MPRRSKISQLPKPVREELEERLVESGFEGYLGLESWLAAKGYRIGKSSIHRHGAELAGAYERILADTRRQRALIKALDEEDDGSMTRGITRIIRDVALEIAAAQREFEDDTDTALERLEKVALIINRAERSLLAGEQRGALQAKRGGKGKTGGHVTYTVTPPSQAALEASSTQASP